MKKAKKNLSVFFNSVIIFLLHIPFVFAKSAGSLLYNGPDDNTKVKTEKANIAPSNMLPSVYDSLKLNVIGLSKEVFDLAVKGLEKLKSTGTIVTDSIISIADFSQPSSNKRLYIIDLNHYSLLFNTYVAHGHNSGTEFAERYSNRPQSLQSSPGFYVTMNTYLGSNGYSLKLNGLEKGINNNALRRDIVIHGAEYVNEKMITDQGYIGRSWGCPAVPQGLHYSIIETIKNGTCLFIYPGHTSYINKSTVLN